MAFIFISTCILIFIGKPASLLILAGSVNGLILPVTLAVMLFATHKSEIVGAYKHNKLLYYTGWIVVLVTAYIGVNILKRHCETSRLSLMICESTIMFIVEYNAFQVIQGGTYEAYNFTCR